MSAERWTLTYPTEPGEWHADDAHPFRCAYCGQWVIDGDGKWVVREPYVGPGQFMAVHRVECRECRPSQSPPRRWWWPW